MRKLLWSQVLRRMCVVTCVTKPAAEQPQPGPEAVNPATPAAKEKKDDDDDDSDTTQVLQTPIAEEVREASVDEIIEDAVEPETGFESLWYMHIDEDKARFTNMVSCLASTAAVHLIMLAI